MTLVLWLLHYTLHKRSMDVRENYFLSFVINTLRGRRYFADITFQISFNEKAWTVVSQNSFLMAKLIISHHLFMQWLDAAYATSHHRNKWRHSLPGFSAQWVKLFVPMQYASKIPLTPGPYIIIHYATDFITWCYFQIRSKYRDQPHIHFH